MPAQGPSVFRVYSEPFPSLFESFPSLFRVYSGSIPSPDAAARCPAAWAWSMRPAAARPNVSPSLSLPLFTYTPRSPSPAAAAGEFAGSVEAPGGGGPTQRLDAFVTHKLLIKKNY